jgi:HD-like signal output (HDOD) protein
VVVFSRGQAKAKRIVRRCEMTHELLHVAERKVLGFDHADVAFELLRVWRLPQALAHAVAHHHEPSRAGEFQREADVVHVADVLVHALQIGSNGEHAVPPLDLVAWQRLGLAPDSLVDLSERVVEIFESVEFSMIGEPDDRGPGAAAEGRC